MASNTENLDLLMKNPSTDGADTFNVQTMLNENWQKIDNNAGTVAQTLANILKPTTPPIIGLPPSTTPDGMFRALGNTGELHVWRKTVTLSEEKPAGYTFGAEESNVVFKASRDAFGVADVANSVSVGNDGSVGLVNPATDQRWSSVDLWQSNIRGKFVKFGVGSSGYITYAIDGIFYITPDAVVSKSGLNLMVSGMKRITGYPLTPAGTTTTYPVSTNPNAYQEGDDAKAAGYTLGEVVSGHFGMGMRYSGISYEYYLADELSVDENGVVSLKNPQNDFIGQSSGHPGSAADWQSTISGKYIQLYKGPSNNSSNSQMSGPFHTIPSSIVYIPNDTAVTLENVEKDYDYYYIDRYQPVTGYAAIPAGTTIEYLGKLGDKARVQFGSYVGTGTFGVSNPNTLNLSFTPRFLLVMTGDKYLTYANFALFVYGTTYGISVGPSSSNKEIPLTMVWGKNSVSWSCNDTSYGQVGQMNNSGTKYRYVAIG